MSDEVIIPKIKEKVNSISNVPASDSSFGKVTVDVATKWLASPEITVLWKTAVEFSDEAAAYKIALSKRRSDGYNRPQLTIALAIVDKQINDGLIYVKGYIIDKYKKETSSSYYPSFGIVYRYKKYRFPIDRNKRLSSLKMMVDAIDANGFSNKEFGTAYWTSIQTQYALLLQQTVTLDGTISIKVSTKNQLKASLKKAMNSLILILKGHYPDTHKAELRT